MFELVDNDLFQPIQGHTKAMFELVNNDLFQPIQGPTINSI